MKDLLKKFLSTEEISNIEAKYKEKNPDATGLPIYVGKTRLDEEISKRKTAEEKYTSIEKELNTLKNDQSVAIEKAVKEAKEAAQADFTKQLEGIKKDNNASECIYKAGGKNVKAIKALIDPSKDIAEEVARLKKEESYLFNDTIPSGTGKTGEDKKDPSAEEDMMRRAVGVII